MRALTKPPLLNRLLVNFFKYNRKTLQTKLRLLKNEKLRASEKKSVYLLTVKEVFFKTKKYYKIKFKQFYFQFFSLSLAFHVSKDEDFFSMPMYIFLQQNMIDYIRFFFWKDITLNKTKYLIIPPVKYWNAEKNFHLLQKFLVFLHHQIFQPELTMFRYADNILFYNLFFYTLNINIEQRKRRGLTKLSRKRIFYFSLDFTKSIFLNKFDQIIWDTNWFLTMQIGFEKTSKYFVDRNYLFATTPQLPRYRKNFFFKFFFKNLFFKRFLDKIRPEEEFLEEEFLEEENLETNTDGLSESNLNPSEENLETNTDGLSESNLNPSEENSDSVVSEKLSVKLEPLPIVSKIENLITEEEPINEGIYIWDRSIQILPFFLNKIFFIHNGRDFIWVRIVPGMVGYKLGQFSFTWKIHTRGVNLKNNYRNLTYSN